jgi:hypothetical protein
MAIVVIGGLITSTFISLLVIPVIFSIVDDLMEWARRHLHRRRAAEGPAQAGAATADIH